MGLSSLPDHIGGQSSHHSWVFSSLWGLWVDSSFRSPLEEIQTAQRELGVLLTNKGALNAQIMKLGWKQL